MSTLTRLGLFAPRRQNLSLGKAVEMALSHNLSPRSIRTYRFHAARLLEHFGDRDLSSIRSQEVEDYIRARLGAGKSTSTVHYEVTFFGRVFRVAGQKGMCPFNPVAEVEKPRCRRGRLRTASVAEEGRMALELRGEDRAIARLAVLTGMRRGELVQMEPRDVNLDLGFVYVREEVAKSKRPRVVPLNEEAVGILERHGDLDGRWVWLNNGNPDRYAVAEALGCRWRRARKQAGVHDLRFHDLRHTTGTRLAMNGEQAHVIQAYLGHTTSRMTDRYVNLHPEFLKGAASRLK